MTPLREEQPVSACMWWPRWSFTTQTSSPFCSQASTAPSCLARGFVFILQPVPADALQLLASQDLRVSRDLRNPWQEAGEGQMRLQNGDEIPGRAKSRELGHGGCFFLPSLHIKNPPIHNRRTFKQTLQRSVPWWQWKPQAEGYSLHILRFRAPCNTQADTTASLSGHWLPPKYHLSWHPQSLIYKK